MLPEVLTVLRKPEADELRGYHDRGEPTWTNLRVVRHETRRPDGVSTPIPSPVGRSSPPGDRWSLRVSADNFPSHCRKIGVCPGQKRPDGPRRGRIFSRRQRMGSSTRFSRKLSRASESTSGPPSRSGSSRLGAARPVLSGPRRSGRLVDSDRARRRPRRQ